ncbi:MAG: hypothetical protein KatS3mg083_521 [Candidatus Dojkabacteria bacterium]|nr:MAG: hypothetical protein KatS3mg083_521 [Candidatus Dojkabacteria bacterium]
MQNKIIEIAPREFETSLHVLSTKITTRVITLVPKIDYARRVYKVDLTPEEIEWLSKEFGTDATPHYKDDEPHKIWGSDYAKVKLRFDRMMLDLSRPVDYVKYKVIKSYPEIVAPSLEAIKSSENPKYAEALFYFLNDFEEIKARASIINERNRAIAFIVSSSPATIRNIAIAMGIAKNYTEPIDEVVTLEMTKLAEEQPSSILRYAKLKASELEILALIRIGLREGIIKKVGDILFMDETELCHDKDALEFFSDKKNKAYLETLRSRVAEFA